MIVFSTAIVSTAHITRYDDDIFSSAEHIGGVPKLAEYDGGYIFYHLPRAELIEGLSEAGVSDAAIKLFCYIFFELGVDYLRLDRDGDEIEHLEKFDW